MRLILNVRLHPIYPICCALFHSSHQITFEYLNWLVKVGKTAGAASQDVTRGATAAALLALKKDPLGFKLRSHFLKKLEVRGTVIQRKISCATLAKCLINAKDYVVRYSVATGLTSPHCV